MPKDFRQLDWDESIEDDCRRLVRLAIREDLDRGHDWTTVALVEPDQQASAEVVGREPGIVAGVRVVEVLLDEMQACIHWEPCKADGDAVAAGQRVGHLHGSARDMLTSERPLLNALGRLSGIATLTRQFVNAISGTNARIYDTRKTVPGWRRLEKYAVRCGGGNNHRTGLYDAVLIKDNHLAQSKASGMNPADAVRHVRQFLTQTLPTETASQIIVEVEVDTIDQLRQVLPAGPDIVLLDNMTCAALRTAVAERNRARPEVQLEASGGIQLPSVREIAATGIDRISIGGLTHSARTLDMAMEWCTIA